MIQIKTQWQSLQGGKVTTFSVKVKEIVVFREKLFGLTEEGHLVFFDEETGKWIRRSSPDVIDPENNELIKCSFTSEAPSFIVPRHSHVRNDTLEDKPGNAMFVWAISSGIIITAILGILLYRSLFL